MAFPVSVRSVPAEWMSDRRGLRCAGNYGPSSQPERVGLWSRPHSSPPIWTGRGSKGPILHPGPSLGLCSQKGSRPLVTMSHSFTTSDKGYFMLLVLYIYANPGTGSCGGCHNRGLPRIRRTSLAWGMYSPVSSIEHVYSAYIMCLFWLPCKYSWLNSIAPLYK